MQTVLFALILTHLVVVAGFMIHTLMRVSRRRNARDGGGGGLPVPDDPSGPPPPPGPSHGIVLTAQETRGTTYVEDVLGQPQNT
jgi:hypothetical protein